MQEKRYPFAVRLIGFSQPEQATIAAALTQAPAAGPAYFCLLDDSLQEPDLTIVNGDDLHALAALSAAGPPEVHPALVIGQPAVDLAFPCLPRPFDTGQLYQLLAGLVARRAEALAQLTARGLPSVPERRRSVRLDVDLTDPSEYIMRRRSPPRGAVLIIDKGGAFRDHVARLLGARRLGVEWTDSAPAAVRLCDETPVSVVMVNTSAPGIDPYELCSTIKAQDGGADIAVVLMVSPAFPYDCSRARAAGVRGMLDKPINDRVLVGTLKRLLSLPA
ncbi:response regulator [Massilia cavernae]|uniref:Response regulator n=1 Tax=Massilia cavernae TaxID=2320864 RepID=A0A418Y5E1_9BURK|nr:response regulator [Massilia cavernae]RJG21804.1 response regulator [Massilia cavernae]